MPPPEPGSPPPHSRNLRAGRWSGRYVCYAVTKNVEGRLPLLASQNTAAIILASLDYLRKSDRIRLLAFCIMPDHYHALFFLLPEADLLSSVMEQVGKYTAARINRTLRRGGRFWQDGFFDRRCRNEEEIDYQVRYIETNPVRAGLVKTAEQWPFGSANRGQEGLLDRDWYAEVR